MKKSKRVISGILISAMIMTNMIIPGNQMTAFGAQYEVKHQMPEAVDSLESLDTSINVTEAGGTNQFPKDASWAMDGKGSFQDAGSIVKTIMTLTENGQQFPYEFVAIPQEVVYLVDCASTESQDLNRYKEHAPAVSLATLINDVPDQAYEEGSWGYTSVIDADMGIKGLDDSLAETKHYTGYWAKGNKVITYKLPLEAGKYNITAALYEWWGQTRDMGMKVNFTDEEGNAQSRNLGNKTISGDNRQDYISGVFELMADQTIELVFFKNSGSQDVVLSGFTVMKTQEEIPEDGVIDFDLDGSIIDPSNHYGGFGAVTCNNTSRLLMDYKEQSPEAYWEIMNLLFDQETGAGLNHIKIEMGADTNSSSGSEPSTMRSPEEEANVKRGAGFIFAADAKTINENIKVELLRWAEPKWTQEGLGYDGDRYEARYQWYRQTIDAAYDTYGYQINEVSPGQNERRHEMDDNFEFTKYLGKRLKEDAENGIGAFDYREIKVVAGDLYRDIGTTVNYLMKDSELRSLVSVIGDHYQITNANKDLQTLIDDYGMKVGYTEATAPMITAADRYNVEQETGGLGGRYGVISHAERYIAAYAYKSSAGYSNRMTYMLFQPAVAAFYEGSAYNPKHLIMATNPWTGYYSADGGIQMVQHFNQFIDEDWVYLKDACYADGVHDDGAVRFDSASDTRLALKDPDTDDYTVVFANNTNRPRTYNITLKNLATKTAGYNVWESKGPESGEVYDANWLQKTGTNLQPEVLDNGNGRIRLTIQPNSMITLTSDLSRGREYQSGQNDSGRENSILELPYRDDFNYRDDFVERRGGTPLYTTDQHGAFEVEAAADGGYSLVHQINNDNRPYTWNVWGSGGDEKGQTTSTSWTALGDHRWANYTAGADIKFDTESNGYGSNFVAIGVRELTHGKGAAYQAKLYADGKWELLQYNTVVQSGKRISFDSELWYRLELRADEDVITMLVDGEELASITDSTVMSGRITLASGFYKTSFDNLQVVPIEGKSAYSMEKLDDTSKALIWNGNVSHALVEGYGHYNRTRTTLSAGDSVSFRTYAGTGFDIFGNTGAGNLTVAVDGEAENVMTPGRSDRETSYWTHGLDDSMTHEVKVTVNSGSYIIDGINLFSEQYQSDGTLYTKELERLIGYAEEAAQSGTATEEIKVQIAQAIESAEAILENAGTQAELDYMALRLKNACIKVLPADAITGIGTLEDVVAEYGTIPELPAEIEVRLHNGETRMEAIIWDEALTGEAFEEALATVEIAGKLQNYPAVTVAVMAEVVPSGLEYFIDCGAGDVWNTTSLEYERIISMDHVSLRNDDGDARYREETGWGFTAIPDSDGMKLTPDGTTGKLQSKFEFGVRTRLDSSPITYKMYLEKGDYSFTGGYYEWWGGQGRKLVPTYSFEHEGGESQVLLEGKEVVLPAQYAKVTSTDIVTVPEDGIVSFTLEHTGNANARGLISYITVTNLEPAKSSVTGIRVAQTPVKTEYMLGEELDITGLRVWALYSDGSERVVANSKLEITGYDKSSIGTQVIKVAYQTLEDTFEASFSVTVSEQTVPLRNGMEEDAANFVLGTQARISTDIISGNVLEITSGWNSDRLNGVAKFKHGQSLFGRSEFTYSSYVYSRSDHERGSALSIGNAERYFSVNLAPMALRYKGGAEETATLSDVKDIIKDEWVRLTVSYEENDTSGIVTIYIDGEEVIPAQEIGFKLSELGTVDGYIGGTFFATSYMGMGTYDDITVTAEAFAGDISQDEAKVTALVAIAEEKLADFSEQADALDFSDQAAAEAYIEQWLAQEFGENLLEGVMIRPCFTEFKPVGERYRRSFAGEPGNMVFSLKVSAGKATANTHEITCELKHAGELGEIPVYDSFSGVADGTGAKEQSLWLDTDGVHIQAHGGQVQKIVLDGKDKWVWYGEDKTRNGNPIDGVNGYMSEDIYNWDNMGTVLHTHDIFPARLGDDGEFADKGICLDEAAYEKLKLWAQMDQPTSDVSQNDIEMAKNFTEAYADPSSDTGYDEDSLKLAFWYMYTGYGIVERPKMLYNEVTGSYVIVYHQDGPDAARIKECIEDGSYQNTGSRYSRASMGFAVADTPFGPFKLVNVQWMNGYPEQFGSKPGMARDMNVFIDDTDVDQNGVPDAYAIYSSEENAKLYISLLNAEYTGPATQGAVDSMTLEDGTEVQTFATRVLEDNSRESPAVFKYDGYYYMFTSGTTGWNPNPGIYYRAEHIYGPWSRMGDFCEGGSNNTFRSQNTAVIPYDPEAGLFIYMGDRWRTENGSSALWYSSHVWLPIQITADHKLEVKKVSDWNLDMLTQYAPVTVNTELPEQVVYGKIDRLPEIVNVTVGDDTFDTAVVWAEPKALGAQKITGTLIQTGMSISFEAMVVLEDAVYFVDSGAADMEGRDYFNLISEWSEAAMLNPEIPDQAYEPGSWGYEGDNTKARIGTFDLYEAFRYVSGGTTGRDLIYSFDGMEEGEYSVYLGFFNPTSWPSSVRVANISLDVDGQTVGTAEHKIADGVKDMVAFDEITIAADGRLSVKISPKNAGKDTDIQISYVAVVKTEAAEPASLTEIKIEALPNKTEYMIGDALDLTGIKVVAVYTDGSKRVLDTSDYVVGDYDFGTAGNVEITLTYYEADAEFITSFMVTVYEPGILSDTRIAVIKEPDRKVYNIGDEFETDGMEVRLLRTATSSNAELKEVVTLDASDYELDYDFASEGTQFVTITYYGTDGLGNEKILEAKLKVTVIDEDLDYYPTKLRVVNKPYRSVYEMDEELDLNGIKVMLTSGTATSSNASMAYLEEITDYEIEGYDSSKTGIQEITVFVEAVDEAGETYLLTDRFKVRVVKNKRTVIEDQIGAVDKQRIDQFKGIDSDFILTEELQEHRAELYGMVKDILKDAENIAITSKTAEYLKALEEAILDAFPQITVTIDGGKAIIDGMKINGSIWGAGIDLSDPEPQNIVISVTKTELPEHDLTINPGSKITGIEFSTKVNGQPQSFDGPVWITMTIPEGHDRYSDVYYFTDGNEPLKVTPVYKNNQLSLWIQLPAVVGFVKEADIEIALEGIEIAKKPAKTRYYYGESLDTTGMVVHGIYSDGSISPVYGYQVEAVTFTSYGKQQVKVTMAGHIAYLEVEVIRRTSGSGGSVSSGNKQTTAPALNASLTDVSGTVAGEWRKDETGWWYALASSGYARNQWAQIGNLWYLFDQNGYMCTGWQKIGNTWYFLYDSGAMAENVWIQTEGKWYYLHQDGAMAVNEVTPDGYRVGADGSWQS